MIHYGQPASPEQFVIGALMPLGIFTQPEHGSDDPLPAYVVTSLHPKSDRHMLRALVSVATLGTTRSDASDHAWTADDRLMSLTPGDVVTLPNGTTAQGYIEPHMAPAWDRYSDPFVKRYVAKYVALLRYEPTSL